LIASIGCVNLRCHRQAKDQKGAEDGAYQVNLEQLGTRIESVQDFWRYNNNTPVDKIKMRESIYLFKEGFKPIWEDRRNIDGGSWTFRMPKSAGPDFWTRVQLLAIGEELQAALAPSEFVPASRIHECIELTCTVPGDQICGVGLSVRFNSHLISVWHREGSNQKSIDGILKAVLDEVPLELRPKQENYFYKKHSDHAGFKAPPELQTVLDSRKKWEQAAAAADAKPDVSEDAADDAVKPPEIAIEPSSAEP
jgi:hypothetical protein